MGTDRYYKLLNGEEIVDYNFFFFYEKLSLDGSQKIVEYIDEPDNLNDALTHLEAKLIVNTPEFKNEDII